MVPFDKVYPLLLAKTPTITTGERFWFKMNCDDDDDDMCPPPFHIIL